MTSILYNLIMTCQSRIMDNEINCSDAVSKSLVLYMCIFLYHILGLVILVIGQRFRGKHDESTEWGRTEGTPLGEKEIYLSLLYLLPPVR